MSRLFEGVTQQALLVLVAIFIATISIFGVSKLAFAADSTDPYAAEPISVSPADQDFDTKAGETKQGQFKVINSGKTQYTFVVYARPYFVQNESYDPTFENLGTNTDVYQWLNLGQTRFKIAPGETIVVPYSITVPVGAKPGGHYGVLFAETQPNDNKDQSVVRKKRVGMVMRVTVDGKVRLEGSVASTGAAFWQTIPPLTANARIKNTGNDDFTSASTLTVRDIFGNVKQKIANNAVVYPGTIRKVNMTWDSAPWFGLFKVDVQSKFLNTNDVQSHFVLLLPRWLLFVFVIFAAGTAYALLRRQ